MQKQKKNQKVAERVTEEKASNFPVPLVSPPAVLPDLPSRARQRRNVTHLDHTRYKILEKRALATNIRLH